MIPALGCKSHINIDKRHGLIRSWAVSDAVSKRWSTSAERFCSTAISHLMSGPIHLTVPERTKRCWKSAGYASKSISGALLSKISGSQQQRANAACSKVRCKVEHVFAHQKHIMGLFIQAIGIERAKVKIAMAKIACNMRRIIWIGKQTFLT